MASQHVNGGDRGQGADEGLAAADPVAHIADDPQALAQMVASGHDEGLIRFTKAAVTYDVSPGNADALSQMRAAIAGALDRDDITFKNPTGEGEVRIGLIFTSINIDDPETIILYTPETAGKSDFGVLLQSLGFWGTNLIEGTLMKVGAIPDPETLLPQVAFQLVAKLNSEGGFKNTFNEKDWNFTTTVPWRNVLISRKTEPAAPPVDENEEFRRLMMGETNKPGGQ